MKSFNAQVVVAIDAWNVAAFIELFGEETVFEGQFIQDLIERQLHRVLCEYVRRVTDGDLASRVEPTDKPNPEAEIDDKSVPAVFAAWWKNASCGLREEFLERVGAARQMTNCLWSVDALKQY